MRALAIDVGSSSVRTAVVDAQGKVAHVHQQRLTVRSPSPGEVELDPAEIARLSLELAARTLDEGGPCDVVGITNQRATTIVFDPDTGRAVGPALSWQDLRTVLDCLTLQGDGLRLAPNQSATKIRWLVAQSGRRAKDLRFATIETWIAWHLSERTTFATDRSNASVNGLVNPTLDGWDEHVLRVLELDEVMLPRLVDTMGSFGVASALAGAPPITALVGDQPASLFGQSCVRRGAKITFGTGAMLDMVHGVEAPSSLHRFASGCYPTVVRSADSRLTWGIEGIILSAGSCVEWLHELGLIDTATQSEELASSVPSADGVSFVPAFSGLGTPQWDFGARGAFFGLTLGSSAAHLARAVLEGIAQRGADLLDAAEQEIATTLSELRVDGGMSANRLFVQRLADFSGHAVAVSSEREATTRGAGLMALVGAGSLTLDDVEHLWSPAYVATPSLSEDQRLSSRAQWLETVQRVAGTIPELSAVSF
ncbi:MAG TPA: FGGY family carbohydrate kinase [Acidimicrobiales bacterium]|nr:FGGY family carbohydrate kinase [Acidimicrobiales bacterium]